MAHRSFLFLASLAAALFAPSATAEVRIELYAHPLHLVQGARPAEPTEKPSPLTSVFPESRHDSTGPTSGLWFVPGYRVDTTDFSDTTLWGARNENFGPGEVVDLTVRYYDVFFDLQHVETLQLQPLEVVSVNVRDVPGLPTDPDGFARGVVRIWASDWISVDYFQVDPSEDLAFGNLAFTLADFCVYWRTRFVSFDPRGSVASFLVNGSQGAGESDPATVVGFVYNEAGEFINSFTIRTDQWVFDVPILDLVLGEVAFGTVQFTIDSVYAGGGLVTVNHSAEGRYSVGLPAVCLD